ncbi:MAG: hypothetical protein O2868_21010, partial [Proteobacteria bacterium]|nr:hypothetical protein [Pseudomonadota bacterium]
MAINYTKHGATLRDRFWPSTPKPITTSQLLRRGICPSCGARRMIETAAHLTDNVLSNVAVRQWVHRHKADNMNEPELDSTIGQSGAD